ncbi:MAG: ParB/RepB/Spo0J family partition protein [Actinomycetota bacterium]
MAKRGGLGRGLSALIPGAVEEGGIGFLEIPVQGVSPNPKQPRTHFDEETIDSLAASIREVGILQPIVVRKVPGGYELIAGERRLRAARKAGLATVPAVVRDSGDSDTLREAIIENIHREDLGPIELAEAFRSLLDDLGLKQETLAERIGVSRSHIANTIRLLQLSPEVQQLLVDGKIQSGHARTLLGLPDQEAQAALALRAAAEGLSVREVEELVRLFVDGPPPAAAPSAAKQAGDAATRDAAMAEIEEILSEQLATRVQIEVHKKRGRVVIEFGSADDLERIVSEIIGSGPGLAPN